MTTKNDTCENRVRSLEITLEEERSLLQAKNALLEANIRELDTVYKTLNEKLIALRNKEHRIIGFEAQLVRANKLSSLGELAGSIAHEIKNPLIAVQGFAKRIGKTKDLEKIGEYSRLIDKEVERLSTVLMKLLDFSRMDEPKQEPVDLHELVNDTVLFMEHHLTRFRNVETRVESGGKPALVIADKIHIQQTLVNIINNAAQAMPGGGTITIRSDVEDGNGFIAVTDEGEGISEDILGSIFEPFFTTKPRGEGTGLGLSLSKKLVEANSGKIEVITKEGKGTTFRLVFPLAEP